MKTRVSVIIPIYNVQEFLEACVESVLSQTINDMPLSDGYERNLQIILVDDGSTDDSASIAKDYAEKYDNIQYQYEENQGLGHARNYGCTFAEGDYIIFLDSDDIVPPDAYRLMYNAAVKNNSDLTIGAVQRFNSKGCWGSNIHNIAFSGTDLVSHITKNHALFYDTTSWNKLILRSFWEEHQFAFPEGILYEDIPVTIPMHFLANNVSIVREVCYLWRVREGISKSITQATDDLKNLNDRLSVMGMVDQFFKENVTDPELFKVKDLKWLVIDLMIFVNKLKSMEKEDSQELIAGLNAYINENISPDAFNGLNEFEKLKYKYLMENNFEQLINIMNFEFEDLKHATLTSKDSHIFMKVPSTIFGTSSLCVDKYIKEGSILRYLQKVSFEKSGIIISGFAVIPGLKNDTKDSCQYSFYLMNCNTRKTIPLEYKLVPIDNIGSFNIKFGECVSYDNAGYQITIPYKAIMNNPDFVGPNRIMATFTQNGITHSFYVGKAKKDVRIASDSKAKMRGENYFSFGYDYSNELIIHIFPVKYRFEKIYIDNNKLCLDSKENLGALYMHYDKDSINAEKNIPFDFDSDKNIYSIPMDNLLYNQGQIQYEDKSPAVFRWKRFVTLTSDNGQCLVNTLRDYYFDIKKVDNISVISDIKDRQNHLFLTTELYGSGLSKKIPSSAVLYFKDSVSETPEAIFESSCSIKNGKVFAGFQFSLANETLTKNLYQGTHDFYIDYKFEDTTITTSLYINDSFEYSYSSKLYDYRVYRSKYGTLRVLSNMKWSKKENSAAKRAKLAKTRYKLLRHLPIKKNRIIFESMWGSKYSCNPRYLYEYIDKNHPEYECIWSLSDEHIPINGNGKRVRRLSLKYLYYLATSKYFVNNVNFHPHYVKRPGQIEIQTMHGTPLKTLGLDVPGDFKTKKQEDDYIERCNRWDYLTVQSDFVADISKQCFLFKKEFIKAGYPRTDILYTKNNAEDITALKKKMGLPLDKKVILYAPTWRLKNSFDLMLDLESFKASLSDDYILILRLHHFSVAGWTQPEKDDFIYDFSMYDSVEELYLVSDLLITDYSSVMFDYSILDRPIILFTYDMEEYQEKLRGLYIDIEADKPGPILYTSRDVEKAIVNLDETEKNFKSFRDSFRKKFIHYECADSAKKIFETVMKNK